MKEIRTHVCVIYVNSFIDKARWREGGEGEKREDGESVKRERKKERK